RAQGGAGDVPARRRGGGRDAQEHRGDRDALPAGPRPRDRAHRRQREPLRRRGDPRVSEARDGAGVPRSTLRAGPRRGGSRAGRGGVARRQALMRALVILALIVPSIAACKNSQGAPERSGGGKGNRSGLTFAADVMPVESKTVTYLVTAPGTIEA